MQREEETITPYSILKVNQKIKIIIQNDKNIKQFSSRVEEINDNYMIFAMPMSQGCPVVIKAGDIFGGKVIANSSAYSFKCNFIDKKLYPLPIWKVSMPYDIKKIQLREFVRIEVMLAVYIQNMPIEEDSQPMKLFTKDISGGGLQVVAKHSIKIGSKLQIDIDIPEYGIINTIGEAVRVEQPQADSLLFWIGIRFLDIQEKDRNKIIKFIFKKELEKRRKENNWVG